MKRRFFTTRVTWMCTHPPPPPHFWLEIRMVCGVSRDAPPSVLCGMHLQKARTLRLKLASASDSFGGVSYPAWGGGDGCTEEQSVAFQEAVSALESALEQSGKEGMQDLKNVRAILIEYAALHALRILPDKVRPQRSIPEIKQLVPNEAFPRSSNLSPTKHSRD